jgi:hypothetical protein
VITLAISIAVSLLSTRDQQPPDESMTHPSGTGTPTRV